MNINKALWSMLAIFVIFAFIISACQPAATEAPAPEEPVAEEPAEPEEEMEEEEAMPEFDVPMIPGGYLEQAVAGDFSGTEVTVDGPFTDPDDQRFFESVAAFEDATGIKVNYIGDKEFEARISISVDAGDPPDIADFPQPGKVASFARQGHLVDLNEFIPQDWLEQQYNQSWLDMGTMAGPDGEPMTAGLWHRFNGKSLVWYPKKAWDAAGYAIPETWDDLLALTQQIADDGDTAWCIGIESQAATGWPATDWTEETMLRTTSLENYDKWVLGELPFSSPEVKNAIETWSEMWLNPDYVYGGTDAIVSTYFGDAPVPMFEDPPKCWMHKQGNFITGFFPEGTEAGVDYGFFYFPPVSDEFGKPFLVAGDVMVMFNDRPEVRALMEFFTTPESASGWLSNGGALAAHLTATPDMYGVDIERGIAELVGEATSFRFDASDLMPGEVGSGSFWTGMTDYVSGLSDLDTALAEIDASWPAGVEGEAQAPSATELGSEANPIKVLFVPSVDTNFMIESGDLIEQGLNDATGLFFEVSVPASYAATIEEMCASPDNTIGFIPAFGYVLANDLCGVEPGLAAERYGWNVYWAQFLVSRDSEFETVEDLEGASWAFPDSASTSGFLFPSALFDELGITVGEQVEAGGHTEAARAVYNGEVDFATTYFSPPLLPEGEGTWSTDMSPDIPDELIAECAPDEEGKLYCGGYRVLDARSTLTEEAPDIVQKVRILGLTDEIPNDTMSFGPEFPEELKQIILDGVIAFIGTDLCAESLCNENFYDWTAAGPIFDENFDGVRLLVEAQGITLENIGE